MSKIITIGELLEKQAAALLSMGRKIEDCDVDNEALMAAEHWLADYQGSFSFLLDLKSKLMGEQKHLSKGQARGVLNCWRTALLQDQNIPRHQMSSQQAQKPKASSAHRKTYTEQMASPWQPEPMTWKAPPMPAEIEQEEDLFGPLWTAWAEERAKSYAAYMKARKEKGLR